MVRDYWRHVASRAWTETLRSLGFESRGRILTAVFSFVVAVSVLLIWGSQDAAGDMALERGALWTITLAAFPFVYFWKYLSTPAKIDGEKDDQITTLSNQITKISQLLAAKAVSRHNILTLSVLCEKGYELSVRRITEEEYEEWAEQLRRWEVSTLKYLASKFSHQDAVSFKNAHYHTRENFKFKVNEDHNDALRKTTTRLNTLRAIIDRYQTDWSPLSAEERAHIETFLLVLEAQTVTTGGNQALDEKGS